MEITSKAEKEFHKLPLNVADRFREAFNKMTSEGFAAAGLDIKAMKGYKNIYRLRKGRYRAYFEFINPSTVIIFGISIKKH